METANRGLDRADLLLTQGTLQATPDEKTHSPAEIQTHVRRAIWHEYGRVTRKAKRIVRLYPYAKAVATKSRPNLFQKGQARAVHILNKTLPSKDS